LTKKIYLFWYLYGPTPFPPSNDYMPQLSYPDANFYKTTGELMYAQRYITSSRTPGTNFAEFIQCNNVATSQLSQQ